MRPRSLVLTAKSLLAQSLLTLPLVALTLAPLPASASTVRIYVTNAAGDSIHVIDPVTNEVVQKINDVVGAHGIAFSPDAARVYVSNEETSTLDVYDRKTGTLIKKVPLSDHPNNISVTKSGDRIVVAVARGAGGLDIVDAATLTLKKTISTHGGRLHNVYVTPDGKFVVGGSIPAKTFYVFDLATEELAWAMPMDRGVRCMAIETNPDGSTRRVYSQLSNVNGFGVIDFVEQKEVARITLPSVPLEFDHGGYRTNEPSHGIGITPDNKTLWVTSIPNNAAYAYALPGLTLIGKVDLPSETLAGHAAPLSAVANWVTFTPDGKEMFVSNSGLGSVSVVDTVAMKVVKVIPVGEVPKRNGTLVIPDVPGRAATPIPGRQAAQ
jgi:YVTN family beta-propeller protein